MIGGNSLHDTIPRRGYPRSCERTARGRKPGVSCLGNLEREVFSRPRPAQSDTALVSAEFVGVWGDGGESRP